MAGDAKIALRWVINNATARFATGKVESEVFVERGFKWNAAVERRPDVPNDMIDFSLRCALSGNNNEFWTCEAEVDIRMLNSDGNFKTYWTEKNFLFKASSNRWLHNSPHDWLTFNTPIVNINDTVTFEFIIKIISSRVRFFRFGLRSVDSNVILKIGDRRLHVSKELLAIHSPVFHTMFFGEFSEKGKEEVEIKDVVFEEFVDVLLVIYFYMDITDQTVPHILKLADRFQMESVLIQITRTEGIDVLKKLILADQYRLVHLRDLCLQSFTSAVDLATKVKSAPEYAKFAGDTIAAICDRLIDLITSTA